jgi:ligand-binding sensor domain-containing protein
VGTENGGLNMLDPVSHRFSRFLPNPEDPTSPNSASIYALYLDEHGTLWIGSYNGGVDILSQYAQRFEYIRAGRGRLSDPHVTAVIEDHTGDLWIGTDGGGLNRRDHETGRFTYYRHDPADQGSIASDVVLSLWEDRQGDIWIGGFPGGLAQLDRQTGRCRRYQIDASDTRRDTVRQIGEYGDNQLLIANGRGMETFDRRTHRFTPLASKYPDLPLETAFSYALHPDGSVWIACPEVGAVRLEPATGKVAIYRSKSGDPSATLTPGDALAVFVDSRGNTWLGTIGGLTCFESGTSKIRRYTTADGLPGATVAAFWRTPAAVSGSARRTASPASSTLSVSRRRRRS